MEAVCLYVDMGALQGVADDRDLRIHWVLRVGVHLCFVGHGEDAGMAKMPGRPSIVTRGRGQCIILSLQTTAASRKKVSTGLKVPVLQFEVSGPP